ncbi:MAG: hypothetical protein ACRCXZ_03520 [Patescibacteria group bacterium]
MIRVPKKYKTMKQDYDKIKNSYYTENSIITSLAVDSSDFTVFLMIKKI